MPEFCEFGPKTVHIDLVNRCNTRCITCWHHSALRERQPVDWMRQEFDSERFLTLLDELCSMGLKSLILSGMGEPTLHTHFEEMLRQALARDLEVTVITNGLFQSFPLDALKTSHGSLTLLLSLNGYDEASWNAFHAQMPPNGFQIVRQNINRVIEAGGRVKLVFVVIEQNALELPKMVKLGHELGACALSFKLASLDGPTLSLALTAATREICKRLSLPQAMGLARRLNITTDLDGFAAQLESSDGVRTAPIEKIGCHLGRLYARVDVSSQTYFCCNTSMVTGSIENQSFSSVWRGECWESMRAALDRKEFFPGCECCGKIKQNLKLAAQKRALEK